jgi:hypothetical protein
MRIMKKTMTLAALMAAAALFGCSGELTDSAAPVELVVTNTQNLSILELNPTIAQTDQDCQQNIGTINMQVIAKRPEAVGSVNAVRVTRYRVSYQRTDGGRLVPAPFVRSIDSLIDVGGSSELSDFLVIEPDALSQAPFAALLPQNGGRDPDTGRPFIKMDVILEVFGETIGGSNVADATRFPLEFCYGCGGCD